MLKVDNIKKSFGANHVLNGISFEVAPGSIYGLIGKNGAGKTTLMNIMAGLIPADSGSVTADITPASTSTQHGALIHGSSHIGYLPDLPNYFEYLTTDEYLDFLLMGKKKERRDELLKTVGLPHGAKIQNMSRGMRQRLGIAAVLVNDPDIILLDEPTSALDPAGRNDVKNILLDLKNKGKTIILSTHILADMDSLCDKAGFMNGGVIAREVDVRKEKESSEEMVITFREEPDLKTLHEYAPRIFIINPTTIKLSIDRDKRLESQSRIFEGLSKLGQEVLSVNTVTLSLDSIFKEVCL